MGNDCCKPDSEDFRRVNVTGDTFLSEYLGNGWWLFTIIHHAKDPSATLDGRYRDMPLPVLAKIDGHELLELTVESPPEFPPPSDWKPRFRPKLSGDPEDFPDCGVFR